MQENNTDTGKIQDGIQDEVVDELQDELQDGIDETDDYRDVGRELATARNAEFSDNKRVIREMTRYEKILSFLSLNKFFIILGSFFLIAGVAVLVSFLTTVKPDLTICVFAKQSADNTLALTDEGLTNAATEMTDFFYPITPDINGDKRVKINSDYFNIGASMLTDSAEKSNMSEYLNTTEIVFADRLSFVGIFLSGDNTYADYFIDLYDMYPSNPNITDRYFFKTDELGDYRFAFMKSKADKEVVQTIIKALTEG
ncbi:MAG: hypothetical protein LBN42_00180 [Oscillospiraceae bacterium]|jgi:hypothetical protein|nr:hypothetical protein [Oscillospiraceae bacterium]